MQLLRLSKMTALGLAFLGSSIQANAQVVHEDIAIYASDAGALVASPEQASTPSSRTTGSASPRPAYTAP